MIDLQECRDEIDKIDSEIIRLFEQRMKVCEDVAEYKIRTGKKVLDPERERQKLEVLRGKAHGEFNQLGAQELFQQVMAISRKRQYQLLTEHGIECLTIIPWTHVKTSQKSTADKFYRKNSNSVDTSADHNRYRRELLVERPDDSCTSVNGKH